MIKLDNILEYREAFETGCKGIQVVCIKIFLPLSNAWAVSKTHSREALVIKNMFHNIRLSKILEIRHSSEDKKKEKKS